MTSLFRHTRPLLPFAALAALACIGPKDNELFARDTVSGAGAADPGGFASAASGTGSAPAQGATAGGGDAGSAAGGSNGNGAADSGGVSFGGVAVGGGGGAGGTLIQPPVIESCDMVEGAVTSELNGHCYRVTLEELTFGAARDACHAAGGHLVTLTSTAEDDFARDLHDGEHWIGASDGFADTMAGVGPYTWVNDEAWEFSNWEDGQPNAFETDCPEGGAESDCFEHCAFQSDEGDWNDRSCWHTIVSICEWDVKSEPVAVGGAGGTPSAH